MKPKIEGNDSAGYRVPFDDPAAQERVEKQQRDIRRREQRQHITNAKHEALKKDNTPLPK